MPDIPPEVEEEFDKQLEDYIANWQREMLRELGKKTQHSSDKPQIQLPPSKINKDKPP